MTTTVITIFEISFPVTVTPDYDPESVTFISNQSTNHKSYQFCLLSR